MAESSKYQKISKNYQKKMENFISSSKNASSIYDAFCHGDTYIVKSKRIESANYNPEWLAAIEGCMIDLGEIIKNPRKVTKTDTNLVPVELAKKTNDESVRHLASHSQYVKNISDKGDVVPDKILNIGADDDFLTYENKFIATLVKRLVLFVEKRYQYIARNTPLRHVQFLKYKTTQAIDGSLVEVETKIRITKVNSEIVPSIGEAYLQRIEEVRRYLRFYYTTDFMKLFKNEKDVKGQILQTNIIRKNPLYHHCYELYRFISNYEDVGAEYNVKETVQELNESEIELINQNLLASFLTINPSNPSPESFAEEKKYKPKIKKTIDDDMYVYAPFEDKAVEFIRVDEDFKMGLEKDVGEIVKNPTKAQSNYQQNEVYKRKTIDARNKEVEKLLKRHTKKEEEFEARQLELKRLEEEHLEELRKKEEERIKKLLEAKIDEMRSDIKAEAKSEEVVTPKKRKSK